MAKTNTELSTKIQAAQAPANGNGKPLSAADQVAAYLKQMQSQIAVALPKHITPDRLARVALTSIRTTPKLLECDISSLMAAVMQSAQLGLEPGILGHAYYVPYGKQAQFIIGYRGLVELAMRTGQYQIIDSDVICEHDVFEFERGYNEKLRHVPNFSDRGKPVAYYAYFILKNGGRRAVVMTKADVDKIRARSKAAQSGPWVSDFDEMAKKTVLRRLLKLAPLSIEVQQHISKDEQLEFGDANRVELNLGDAPEIPANVPPRDLLDAPVPDSQPDQGSFDGGQAGSFPVIDTIDLELEF